MLPNKPNDTLSKTAALALLSRGLVSKSEAARLAGVSRQLMRHWSKGIKAEKAREAVLTKLWRKSFP
jgi:hypothetical protein